MRLEGWGLRGLRGMPCRPNERLARCGIQSMRYAVKQEEGDDQGGLTAEMYARFF